MSRDDSFHMGVLSTQQLIVILRPPSYTKTCNYQAVMSVIMLPVYLAVLLPAAVYKACCGSVSVDRTKGAPRHEADSDIPRMQTPQQPGGVVGFQASHPPSECVRAIYIGPHIYYWFYIYIIQRLFCLCLVALYITLHSLPNKLYENEIMCEVFYQYISYYISSLIKKPPTHETHCACDTQPLVSSLLKILYG